MKTFVAATAALAIAMGAASQVPDKSLVVTLKDGTSATYNLADIEHLTFGEPVVPMGEVTSGPYSIGDYWCDGTNHGVVASVDPKGEYGTILAMTDFSPRLAWGTEWEITDALDFEYGPANMATVAAIDPTFSRFPAFKACAALGEGWYLPAQKELQALRANLTAINETLAARGGRVLLTDTWYWSSSEAEQYSDATAYAADLSMPGMFGISKDTLLPVRAFREFGEKPVPKYVIGQLCTEEGRTGMVYWISDDGDNARMIALSEAKVAWGQIGTNIGASSDFDGEANLKGARAADASLAAYPAFKACTDLGDGWYLPSQKELAVVTQSFSKLNAALKANSATELSSAYYWTSTEYPADAENSAIAMSMVDGSTLASSKAAERLVRAVSYLGPRPEEDPTYGVGDIYYEAGQPVGVVFKVSDDAHHGLIASLTNVYETGRINAMWDVRANSDNYVLIGMNDVDDGANNLAKALENDPELASLTALRLATEYGSGWYIGALNEMKALYEAFDTVNATLKTLKDGGTSASTIDKDEYWTSTEGSENPLERVTSIQFKNGTTFDYRKYFYMRVRPIRKF